MNGNLSGLSTADALAAERAALSLGESKTPSASALCLSGGGIRSAAFCLGVLQALEKRSLLKQFHYLSTVSGGGYIGSWLQFGFTTPAGAGTESAPSALNSLRSYTNFLTPAGVISLDAFAGIVLWLRNTILNWLIFLPLFLAVAFLPAIYKNFIILSGELSTTSAYLLAAGVLVLVVASINGCRFLPTHNFPSSSSPGASIDQAAARIDHWVVFPVLIWATVIPAWIIASEPEASTLLWPWPLAAAAFVALVLGYLLARLGRNTQRKIYFRRNFLTWIATSLVPAGLLWAFAISVAPVAALFSFPKYSHAIVLAVLGPLCVVIAHVLHSTVYVGFRRRAKYEDLDREWIARLNARILLAAVAWTLLAASTILLPLLIGPIKEAAVAALSGPIGAFLAKSAFSLVGKEKQKASTSDILKSVLTDCAIFVLAAIFAASAFSLLGYSARQSTDLVSELLGRGIGASVSVLSFGVSIVFSVLLFVFAWLVGKRINIDRFSMHGVYRMRLTRAFLGTARNPQKRREEPFTRFDPEDNISMTNLWTQRPSAEGCLFPVINTTLNLVATHRLAWKERKGASFTITPLHCGSSALGPEGTYVATNGYAGRHTSETAPAQNDEGISLGTAMTVSGAAVSPSMGYHSSPIATFLLTLFNVRLGIWLPNPAFEPAAPSRLQRLGKAGPENAVRALANELLGRTTDQTAEIYLSDGGHFDNLGLYEMLRRRCKRIVVVDAGADPNPDFADLGIALRLASIDGLAEVTFVTQLRKGEKLMPRCGAFAKIKYPNCGEEGALVYFKSHLPERLPADIVSYAAAHDRFPHDTTLDQFFGESQFESYRHLGYTIVDRALSETSTLKDLFKASKEGAGNPQTR